jgi:nucleoside-diphosphate-sugar epimerase
MNLLARGTSAHTGSASADGIRKQIRDNIHSHDWLAAVDHFFRAPRAGEVYNIGGGRLCSCSVLEIEEPHFAANMETGLKPLLAGFDIREVPISWINRTSGMGTSSFDIAKVAPGYFRALMRTIWRVWRGRRDFRRPLSSMQTASESVDAAR